MHAAIFRKPGGKRLLLWRSGGVLLVLLYVALSVHLTWRCGVHHEASQQLHLPARPATLRRAQQQQQQQQLQQGGAAAAAAAAAGFSSLDAGIQQATLWGMHQGSPLVVHAWLRFLCAGDALLVRGFALAEDPSDPPTLLYEHPRLAGSAMDELPQLQLRVANGTWVDLQQLYVRAALSQEMNTWHFEAALPRAAEPRSLGVEGWARSADMLLPGGGCVTPAAAQQQLPWRRPGSVWAAVSSVGALTPPPADQALLVDRHLQHHLRVGLTGTLLMVDDWDAPQALVRASDAIRRAVERGQLWFWVWEGVRVSDAHYYPQTHMYNAALLAAWGAGVQLVLADLDEWLVVANQTDLRQALAPGGCMAGAAQVRLFRVDVVNRLWQSSAGGELGVWRTYSGPCKQLPFQYTEIGEPNGVQWKSLVNPDLVSLYHTHNGIVLNGSFPASSARLSPHAGGEGAAAGPDLEAIGYQCAHFMHFVNLYKARRRVGDKDNTFQTNITVDNGRSIAASCKHFARPTAARARG